MQGGAGKKPDSIDTGPSRRAVDIDTMQNDDVGRRRVDDDAIHRRIQHTCLNVLAGDRHGFGDGHPAEAAWIDAIDFAAGGGFRDCTGKGLARCGAAARIGIIANAGNPRPGRLCGRRRGKTSHYKCN